MEDLKDAFGQTSPEVRAAWQDPDARSSVNRLFHNLNRAMYSFPAGESAHHRAAIADYFMTQTVERGATTSQRDAGPVHAMYARGAGLILPLPITRRVTQTQSRPFHSPGGIVLATLTA